MPLFVRIRDVLYHVPSISCIKVKRSSVLKRPTIFIHYHRGKPDKIKYSTSTGEFQKDYLALVESLNQYTEQIKSIPLFVGDDKKAGVTKQ